MAANGHDGGVIASINVTPLVDIMLVLLIIFMVTAKLTAENALPIELPRASSGGPVQAVFSIALLADGGTVVDGSRVKDDDTLLPLAREVRARTPDVRAVIQADGRVLHERVVHVMDLLARADIAQIAFAVVDPG